MSSISHGMRVRPEVEVHYIELSVLDHGGVLVLGSHLGCLSRLVCLLSLWVSLALPLRMLSGAVPKLVYRCYDRISTTRIIAQQRVPVATPNESLASIILSVHFDVIQLLHGQSLLCHLVYKSISEVIVWGLKFTGTLLCGTWWHIGWVHSFQLEGRGFDSRSSRHVWTLGMSLTHSCLWRFGVKLRHSIRAVSGAPLSSSGLEEAL